MRILFMGTPDFAVASLRRLVADGHQVCGVFTQPDKPKNRGHKLVPTPVKEYALTQNIPVYQPEKLRDGTALELVKSLAPELTVVAAYGRILPEDILEAPRYGSINVHSSLLPKYRGAAPINWAILNGEQPGEELTSQFDCECAYDTSSYDNNTGIIPSYLLTPTVVTADNIQEELVDTGYYTMGSDGYPVAVG